MADKTMLAVGGVAVAGLLYFMSKGDGETSTLDDTQATSFVGISGGDSYSRVQIPNLIGCDST